MHKTDLTIPDVLGGCETAAAWECRRADILENLVQTEYGKRPDLPYEVSWSERLRASIDELNAVHIHTELTVRTELGAYTFPVAVFLPKRDRKVPAAVLICSQSKSIQPMQLPSVMAGKRPQELAAMAKQAVSNFRTVLENPARSASAMFGTKPVLLDLDSDYDNGHWPVRAMMKRGFGMVGFYAADAEPDDAARYPSGLAKIFGTEKERSPHEWGVLAVWAFAASCVRQYVCSLEEVDEKQIAVIGHSRCGKAALLCGASDTGFAAVMPNGSGCCGAALSRGKSGESIASIQAFFPHWFAPSFRQYAGREGELPFDQHFLLAAVAPRLLHVGSGSEDFWADPRSEHLGAQLASRVWTLYGEDGLPVQMPEADTAQVCGHVGYHLRRGPHKLDTYDWICLQEHMNRVREGTAEK
ncbi:MAG: hypothetical protein LUC48_05080 [Clostridiales bacterium]|nr:hypothetical protein [Clostridiales bacterium]